MDKNNKSDNFSWRLISSLTNRFPSPGPGSDCEDCEQTLAHDSKQSECAHQLKS